jgi:intracellular sulfur oxidation DsrE/DsrF family protein
MKFKAATCSFALVCVLAASAPSFAQTQIASPAPSIDRPRRIMLQLSADDQKVMNSVLTNAVNLQKFYGPDRVEVVVVVFGPGMKALYKKTSPVADRVSSLMQYEVSFVGCRNTMEATRHTEKDLIPGVKLAQAGIAEIVERQLSGWTYVRP